MSTVTEFKNPNETPEEQAASKAAAKKAAAKAAEKAKYRAVLADCCGSKFANSPTPVVEWDVEGIMTRGGALGLFGAPGGNKSASTLGYVNSVASEGELGTHWLGSKINRFGGVCIISEDTELNLRIRLHDNGFDFRKWGHKLIMFCTPDQEPAKLIDEYGKPTTFFETVMEVSAAKGVVLTLVDTMTAFFDVNTDGDPLKTYDALMHINRAARQHDISIIIVGHTNRAASLDGSDDLRAIKGSQSILGALRCAILLRPANQDEIDYVNKRMPDLKLRLGQLIVGKVIKENTKGTKTQPTYSIKQRDGSPRDITQELAKLSDTSPKRAEIKEAIVDIVRHQNANGEYVTKTGEKRGLYECREDYARINKAILAVTKNADTKYAVPDLVTELLLENRLVRCSTPLNALDTPDGPYAHDAIVRIEGAANDG